MFKILISNDFNFYRKIIKEEMESKLILKLLKTDNNFNQVLCGEMLKFKIRDLKSGLFFKFF